MNTGYSSPVCNRWCFNMKQQGYNGRKANIPINDASLNSLPNATSVKIQAGTPQQRLNTHTQRHTHTGRYDMPAQGPFGVTRTRVFSKGRWAIFHSLSPEWSHPALLYVQINVQIYKASNWKAEMDTTNIIVDLPTSDYISSEHVTHFQHSVWIKWINFLEQNLHW